MSYRLVAGSAIAGVLVPLAWAAPTASASGMAHVRIVDHYTHGRVEVSVNGVTRRLSYGGRTGWIAITPDAMHNDSYSVRALRYKRCGSADIGYYFRAGHSYRIRINDYRGGRCGLGDGRSVRAPGVHIDPSTY